MKSLLSYIIPIQILPSTIYDINKQKQDSWTMPLQQIIVLNSKKNKSISTPEKKIDAARFPRPPNQNESFSSV